MKAAAVKIFGTRETDRVLQTLSEGYYPIDRSFCQVSDGRPSLQCRESKTSTRVIWHEPHTPVVGLGPWWGEGTVRKVSPQYPLHSELLFEC